jgi:hypothetical protein
MTETSNDSQPTAGSWNPGSGNRFANVETCMQDRRASVA